MCVIFVGKKIRRWKCDSTAEGYIEKKRVWMKRKKNTGIRCSEPREQIFPSGSRWRTAAPSSSSIATRYTATGTYIRIHTRTSCSSVQYNNSNRSGPGTLLRNRTRCLRNKKRKNSVNNTQSSSSSASSSMYVYKTDFSIAQTTLQSSSMMVHILTLEQKKNVTKTKKKNCAGLDPPTPSSKGQQPICPRTKVLRDLVRCLVLKLCQKIRLYANL